MSLSINNKTIKSLMKDGKEIVKVERVADGKILYEKESNYVVATFTGNSITIGGNNNVWLSSVGDVVIDWGDGTTDTVNNPTTRLSHTYNDGLNSHNIVFLGEVTSLEKYCFYHCTGLTSVRIPSNVTSLGGSCFDGCTGLTSITMPNSVTSLGDYCFSNTSLTSITIPSSVTSLGNYCFYDCTDLTSITIPNTITSLGFSCFMDCTGLASITIPSSVTNLGSYCFHGCTGLTSIIIPDNVTTLGSYCFSNTSLTSITIPSSVTRLGNNCFHYCTNLIDYQLYWTRDNIITYDSNKMPNKTNSIFTIPVGETANYVAKRYPSDKLVERTS